MVRPDSSNPSRHLALFALEAVVIAGLFWADINHWHHVVVFSKTPYILLLGWLSLRLRGLGWRAVGFCPPPSWPYALALGVAAGSLMEALELCCTQPILGRLFHQPPDLSLLAPLRGNLLALFVVLLLTWTLAAFGEELVWRGYLLNRIALLFGAMPYRWPVAILVTSALFGLAHFVEGPTGMAENAIDGALLCGLYLMSGRNLWIPIVANGVTDTLDSLLLYSGHYPLG